MWSISLPLAQLEAGELQEWQNSPLLHVRKVQFEHLMAGHFPECSLRASFWHSLLVACHWHIIKAPTESVQEGIEREGDYAVSDRANKEGTDISPKYPSRHSKFSLSSLPGLIFSGGPRNKAGSTTSKLWARLYLMWLHPCTSKNVQCGRGLLKKYPRKGILEELHKSNIPIPLPTYSEAKSSWISFADLPASILTTSTQGQKGEARLQRGLVGKDI